MPSPLGSHESDTPALKTALDERRPILLAMADDIIERQPKVDASVAAEAVIGSALKIEQYRDAIVAQFGVAAGTLVDELLVVARATKQADVELSAAAAMGDLSPMDADLRVEHNLLFTDAQSLANRKRIELQRLEPARGVLGYRQLIHSTLVLVALLRELWGAIKDHTPITEADLERTETKALRMLTALGERDQGATRVPAAELRLRALSALVRHYDEVRRMVSYLRWHEDDADDIAPSLYTRRPGRRSREDETDVVVGPVGADSKPVTGPVGPVIGPVGADGKPLMSLVVSPTTGVPVSPFVT